MLADFRLNKSSDIIQLLVSIYDSKDVFIKELQVLLAQRLLAIKNYDLEAEVRPSCGFAETLADTFPNRSRTWRSLRSASGRRACKAARS